jgi:hypothetical protein
VLDHTKLESSRTMEIFAKPSRCSYGIKNLWLPHGCVMLLFGAAAAGGVPRVDTPVDRQQVCVHAGGEHHGGSSRGRGPPQTLCLEMDLSSLAGPRLQTGFAAFLTHDWGSDTQSRDNHARVRRANAALQQVGFRCCGSMSSKCAATSTRR